MSYLNFFIWWLASTWLGILSQCKYSKEWDEELNHLLDMSGSSAAVGDYTIELDGSEVWIRNHLYAYGHKCGVDAGSGYRKYFRPSIRTMHRLYLCVEWHRAGKP